jgi:ABC-type amino acid transport substrate-binding protein
MAALRTIGFRVAAALAVGYMALASAAFADTLDDIRKSGVLHSANGLMGLKPYAWQNTDGSTTGFEWEMLQYIAKKIGAQKGEYVITEWTSMIPGLKAKRWDIILSGMAVTQERIQGGGIEYSNPYIIIYDTPMVMKDSPIKTMADLKGKILGSTLGTMDSINAHWMVDQGMAKEAKDFNDFGQPFVALKNKQIDSVILDQITYIGQKDELKDLAQVEGPSIFYRSKPDWAEAEAKAKYKLGGVGIGVRKEDTRLLEAINAALADMTKDGTRKAILTKYNIWSPEQEHLMKE